MNEENNILNGFSRDTAPVMDLDYDLYCSFHTPEILRRKVELLAEAGFKRLYVIAPPPGQPDYTTRIIPEDGPPNYLRQSRAALGGDPLDMVCEYAKDSGLELWITMKPYEGGGGHTVPHGFEPPCNRNWLETLGGRAVGLDPFLIEHPGCLVQRKPYNNLRDQNVSKIEIICLLNDSNKENRSIDNDIPTERVKSAEILISNDNGNYQPYKADFSISEYIETRTIKNANGEPALPEPVQCRIIQITGLDISAPYFAVQLLPADKYIHTIPYSMITAFSDKSELPVTVSTTIRDGAWTGKDRFDNNGFEFEEMGPYYWDCGWKDTSLFGIARGKVERLRGCLCEAYPEVQDHWLKQVERYIKLGCTGIEFRIQAHASSISDFINYGFNPPLIKAYKEKYGIDILEEPVDPIKMMFVRGIFFEEFLQKATNLLHNHNCKIQIQLNDCFEHPTTEVIFDKAGFWPMPKAIYDWKRTIDLADEITIKDYNWGKYNRDNASNIKEYCTKLNKPLWIHCYLQQGHDLNQNFIKEAENDSRVTGIMLYEVVWNERENDGIIRVHDDGRVTLVL